MKFSQQLHRPPVAYLLLSGSPLPGIPCPEDAAEHRGLAFWPYSDARTRLGTGNPEDCS